MKNKKLIDYIPFFVMIVLSIVTILIYTIAMHGARALNFVKIFIALIAPLIIPFVNYIFKIKVPIVLNVLITFFCFVSLDLGSVLDFYALIPHYDKFLHTTFGFTGALGVFIFLLYGKGRELKPWCFFVVILLCVVGIAGLWEIYEYVENIIAHSNVQRWLPDMEQVGNMTVSEFFKTYDPLWDTIWDIIVAIIGTFAFFASVLIDKFCGYKMCKNIYNQTLVSTKQNSETNNLEKNKTVE